MVDKILVSELMAYVKYDKLLQWQRVVPWINNFAAKVAKGTFSKPRAEKALGDYMTRDAWERYAHGGRSRWSGSGRGASDGVRIDAATKLLFGKRLLTWMMPRIRTTAKRMKEKGVVKGKLNMAHPEHPHIKLYR